MSGNFDYICDVPRNYPYHEEVKIMMSEVFRDGDMTDQQWTHKYELLKQKTPLEQMGKMIELIREMGYTLEEAAKTVKQLLVEAKKKNDITT